MNQLLSLARAEPRRRARAGRGSARPARLARDTTTEWVPRAIERDIDLGFDSPLAGARCRGRFLPAEEMLNNLLDNAIRYTQRGGHVTVRVPPDSTVTDAAPSKTTAAAYPITERGRVFERFYRVLGTGADGCGLGPAIVKEIAQSHGGDAGLASGASGSGTLVTITLPMAA